METRKNNFWKIAYSIITIIILLIQVNLYIEQNRISSIQNRILASNKEYNYSTELFNIIDLVSNETNSYSYEADSINDRDRQPFRYLYTDLLNYKNDSLRVKLSPVLSNRIISFTNYIEAYSIIGQDGELKNKIFSPERKNLLIYLINSYADTRSFLFDSNFSQIYLNDFEIRERSLRGLNTRNSHLKNCLFYLSDLSPIILDQSHLENVRFSHCNMIPSDFKNAILDSVSFGNSYLPYAIHFKDAYLKHIDLDGALVPERDWLDQMKEIVKKKGNIDDFEITNMLPVDTLTGYSKDIYFYQISKKKM